MTGFSEGVSDIQIFMPRVLGDFLPGRIFSIWSPREKKRGRGWGVSVKLSGDQMPNDAYNDEYQKECEGVRHGLSSLYGLSFKTLCGIIIP